MHNFTKVARNVLGLFVLLLCQNFAYSQSTSLAEGFSVSDTIGCTPLQISFQPASTGSKYYWDFGNGNTSTLTNPSNVYTSPGRYTVKLTVTDAGKSQTYTLTNVIRVVESPVAAFGAANQSVCPGADVNFINISKNSTSYVWDFGDGNTSTIQNPSHSYKISGTYTVKMIASNIYGCRDVAVKTAYITVFPKPVPDFAADKTDLCDSMAAINFTNKSTNGSKYIWSFGDGSTSAAQSPSHSYGRTGIFTVKLFVTSSSGCTDSLVKTAYIKIGKLQKPDFTANSQAACQQSLVRFTCLDSNATGWNWDFGDGTSSNLKNPVHTYDKSGSYTVKLTVTSNGGCSQQITKSDYITVKGFISANFTGGGRACAPYTASFKNFSANSVSWLWEMGDGTTSTDKNPVHTYAKPGVYSVILHAFGSSGCEKVAQLNNIVNVAGKPILSFKADNTQGCPPYKAKFAIDTTNLRRWTIDFGDTSYSTASNPVHTYLHEGNYTVKLIGYNQNGCPDTITVADYIKVANPKVIYAQSSPIIGCAPYSTTFTDATTDNVSWFWDFGDGTSSTEQNAPHTYAKAGKYNIRLVTRNSGGCTETINNYATIDLTNNSLLPDFTAKNTACPYAVSFKDSTQGAASWFWDFGDGSTASGPNPVHQYTTEGTYKVTLTVKSAYGCAKTITKTIQGNKVLKGSITPGTAKPIFPATINFASNSVGATHWHWDFGDGDTSNLANPTHTFKDSGDYKTTLTISDGNCSVTYTVRLFHVEVKDQHNNNNSGPGFKAAFSGSTTAGCVPVTVKFSNISSSNASSYLWRFGDGTTSRQKEPVHTYTKSGSYTVTLIAQSSFLDEDSSVVANCVVASDPKSSFTTHQYISKSGYYVQFADSSRDASNRQWSFGDGTTSTEQSPTHTFATGRSYPVNLTVFNNNGCSNGSNIILNSNYVDVFNKDYNKGCVGQKIQFSSIFTRYKNIRWDFGDGNTLDDDTAYYAYSKRGTYMVSVTITDKQGNQYTYYANDSITVSDPRANFTVTGPTVHCDSLAVAFTNKSIDANQYLWDFGDGGSSTQENPVHTFRKAGTFSVSLTAYKNGCSDISTAKDLVTINAAQPDFSFTQNAVCLPITATFTDKSKNATSWFWDFGDGTTSTLQNPVHTYNTKPAGTVSLTIYDTHGCKGTIKKNNVGFIKAMFNANLTSGCGPLTIAFADNSDYASSWLWSFGDGATSTKQNPVHYYSQDGFYTVKLTVRSSTGCIDSITKSNYIHVSHPTAAFFSPDKANCAPSYVTFKDQSKSAVSWFWDFGDSVYSYNSNPGHIYNRPGTYTVKLVVKNSNGCSDTMIKKNYVRVLGPISAMTASATKACPGTEVSFTDHSIDAVAWDWNFGDGSTSHDRNPKHAFTDPGNYTVTLITHDTFGCTSLATLDPQIKVFDKLPPVVCPIRRVTVNSNTSVEIDWTASHADDFSAYRLYRLNEKTGKYALVATINDANKLTYVDEGLNTLANTYTFKLQTVDFCGFAVSLDSLQPHTTVNVSAVAQQNDINVNWTPYKGCTISGYSIFRMTPGNQDVRLIAMVPATQLHFTDTTWSCPIPYAYRIVANNICGDSLMSFSDTAIATPQNLFKDQKVDVVRSTVVDNKSVLTEWKAPTVLPQKVSGYKVLRSPDGFSYSLITIVPAVETSYMDNDVDVSKQRYFYRIEAANECDIQTQQGLHGSSILLGVRNYDDRVQLDWTGYDGWTKGVGYYVIERMRSDGTWETVGKVDGKRTTFDDEQH